MNLLEFEIEEKKPTGEPWIQDRLFEDDNLLIPINPSAFSMGKNDLCESKVHLICGSTSVIVSG